MLLRLFVVFFQEWHNFRVHLQKPGPIQKDVQWLSCSFQLPPPFLWWRRYCMRIFLCSVKLLMQSGFPFLFHCSCAYEHPFRIILRWHSSPPVTQSLLYCSLQCAGPSGMTGMIPVEQGTGNFWVTWRKKTQDRSVSTHSTLRLLLLTQWPQPSLQGRSSICKLPHRETI